MTEAGSHKLRQSSVAIASSGFTPANAPATAVKNSSNVFEQFAALASNWLGCKWAFLLALIVIMTWAVSGPIFHFSDTWQLVINTGTTIVTFLMVFLIQNTQNRDARAINLKLDELIHAIDKAKDDMVDIEKLSDEELDRLQERFQHIRQESTEHKGSASCQ